MLRLILLLVLTCLTSDCQCFIQKGFYKIYRRGGKFTYNNESFNNRTIFKTNYLKIINSESAIKTINLPSGAFSGLTQLEHLELTKCHLKSISPGAFDNLPNLDTLQLQENQLSHIKKGIFNNLLISSLSLQRNEISKIDSDAFNDMPNLARIKLNKNKISQWDPNWFYNTPRLTDVIIRRNHITELPANAFRNLKGVHEVDSKTDVVDLKLFFSRNLISEIHSEAFNGLESFKQLWLDRNNLSYLDKRVFSNVRQLSVLFLSRNKLHSVDEDLFPNLKEMLEILDLKGNNFTCLPLKIVSKTKVTNIDNNKNFNQECLEELRRQLRELNLENEISFNSDI